MTDLMINMIAFTGPTMVICAVTYCALKFGQLIYRAIK